MTDDEDDLERVLARGYEQRTVLCTHKLGVIEKAREKETGRMVAIKQVTGFSKQTIRELRLYRTLRHENILTPDRLLLSHTLLGPVLCKISPLMDSDLNRLITEGSLTDEHCQFFLYQLLRGLKYMHSSGVAHRSLSPRHILVNCNCELKVGHLETACLVERESVPTRLLETVKDRWYLSPERLLGERGGGKEDDMWAVGCILAELLLHKPLFSSPSASDQLHSILTLVSGPNECNLSHFESVFTLQALKALSTSELNRFGSVFAGVNPLARSLLAGLLKFNVEERTTVGEALEHEYLSDFHDYEDEPTGDLLTLSHFSFELDKLSSPALLSLLQAEVQQYPSPNS